MTWGCDEIVLVVPPDHIPWTERHLGDLTAQVVAGGDVRQQSVANGLERVSAGIVFVHDAARPFVELRVLDELVKALDAADAAIPVVPVDETLKHISEDVVTRTVERAGLALSQTPQAFRGEVLREAHVRASAEGRSVTDDAELIELYKGTVATVRGSRTNIKLTYPEDFALAEAMVAS